MKTIRLCCAALALVCGQLAIAQSTNERNYPNLFVGINAGAQTTFSDYKQGKLITPMYGVSFGTQINPILGARLHVGGVQNKGGIKELDRTYKYKYVVGDIDLMVNLINLFAQSDQRWFNLYLLGGAGVNYAFDNDDFGALAAASAHEYPLAWSGHRFSHNIRAGLLFDFEVARHIGLNIEVAANNTNDRYNSKNSNKDDWWGYASIGVAYKFRNRKKSAAAVREEPVTAEEVWATRTDTVAYDEVTYREEVAPVTMTERFFYDIRLSDPEPAAKIQAIVAFAKELKDCHIQVTAYADKGTGNARVNKQYSKERANKVVEALVAAGIDRSMISAAYMGDTEQPYEENDKNRVTIVEVRGMGVKQEPVTTRKYRLEEVRYRVK